MSETPGWNSEIFDVTLREYLERLSKDKWPRALNKKGFFIALRAMSETPAAHRHSIYNELFKPITAVRHTVKPPTSGTVPRGYAISAIRAAKHYQKMVAEDTRKWRKSGRGSKIAVWRGLITKKFESMLGGRVASTRFMRVGWLAVVKALGRFVREKSGAPSGDPETKARGAAKGEALPAQPQVDMMSCVIRNSAQSTTDKRNGLFRLGEPALQRAFDAETANMREYLDNEAMKEEAEKFNAAQR